MIERVTDFIEKGRVLKRGIESDVGSVSGAYTLKHPSGSYLFVIVGKANQVDWVYAKLGGPPYDHVSVSVNCEPKRLPTWDEMNWVKDLFWEPEETAVQYHPKKSEYVNFNPWVLHLWSIPSEPYLLPPSILVGPKS